MSGNVQFEGMIRVSGSVTKVEKALATLKKAGIEVLEAARDHPDWRIPRQGMPVPLDLWVFLRDAKFLKKRVGAFNKTVSASSKVPLKYLPDWGICGGRKYYHLHLGNKILPMSEAALSGVIREGMKELREMGLGNEIR